MESHGPAFSMEKNSRPQSSRYEEWPISESSSPESWSDDRKPDTVSQLGSATGCTTERQTARKRHENKVVARKSSALSTLWLLLKYRRLLHDSTVQVGLVSGDDCRRLIALRRLCGVHWSTCVCSISCVPASAPGSLVSMLQSEELLSLWSMLSSVLSWAGAVCWEGWEPIANLACRMQFSHCCLLKASLAWKEWDWSWPPLRNVTLKKFLAGREGDRDVCYNEVWSKPSIYFKYRKEMEYLV